MPLLLKFLKSWEERDARIILARIAHEVGLDGEDEDDHQVGPDVAQAYRRELLFKYPDYRDIKRRQLHHVCSSYNMVSRRTYAITPYIGAYRGGRTQKRTGLYH